MQAKITKLIFRVATLIVFAAPPQRKPAGPKVLGALDERKRKGYMYKHKIAYVVSPSLQSASDFCLCVKPLFLISTQQHPAHPVVSVVIVRPTEMHFLCGHKLRGRDTTRRSMMAILVQ